MPAPDLAASVTPCAQQAFYVSPDGNDSSLGTVAAPFRTLERAKSAVRTSTSAMSGDIRVFLRDGTYPLVNTFFLDDRDSGRNGYSVIYESYPGEHAMLSGGQRITGWTAFNGRIYRASVGTLRFRQLYVNGVRAVRARTPSSGDYHLLRAWDTGGRRLEITRDEISQWGALGEVELIVLGKGVNQANLRIASFVQSGTSAFVTPKDQERTRIFQQVYPPKEQRPFYFENALEFLDQPGEWYLDTGAGQLYYLPRPGEDMTTSVVVAPVLERLVELSGSLNSKEPLVRRLHVLHSAA